MSWEITWEHALGGGGGQSPSPPDGRCASPLFSLSPPHVGAGQQKGPYMYPTVCLWDGLYTGSSLLQIPITDRSNFQWLARCSAQRLTRHKRSTTVGGPESERALRTAAVSDQQNTNMARRSWLWTYGDFIYRVCLLYKFYRVAHEFRR